MQEDADGNGALDHGHPQMDRIIGVVGLCIVAVEAEQGTLLV